MSEIDLVFEAIEVLSRALVGRRGHRIEHAEPFATLEIQIHQKIGKQNIGWRDIELRMEQVAAGPTGAAVLIFGQPVDELNIVFGIEVIGKPGAAFLDRSRKTESGRPAAEMKALV